MLTMLLLLSQTALAEVRPSAPAEPGTPPAAMQVIGQTTVNCRSGILRAADPTQPDAGLMWREGGGAVGMYRLLERRVNGCPAPVIVNYRIPGSNAVGREMNHARPEQPVTLRRP